MALQPHLVTERSNDLQFHMCVATEKRPRHNSASSIPEQTWKTSLGVENGGNDSMVGRSIMRKGQKGCIINVLNVLATMFEKKAIGLPVE